MCKVKEEVRKTNTAQSPGLNSLMGETGEQKWKVGNGISWLGIVSLELNRGREEEVRLERWARHIPPRA